MSQRLRQAAAIGYGAGVRTASAFERATMPIPRVASLVLLALAGCEGTHDLTRGCLPMQVPTEVVLQQPAALYALRDEPGLLWLRTLPLESPGAASGNATLVRDLAPGTRLRIDALDQEWGFDSGAGIIRALGETDDGARFMHDWGYRDEIRRAPWEPPSTPTTRAVTCER